MSFAHQPLLVCLDDVFTRSVSVAFVGKVVYAYRVFQDVNVVMLSYDVHVGFQCVFLKKVVGINKCDVFTLCMLYSCVSCLTKPFVDVVAVEVDVGMLLCQLLAYGEAVVG